jgi:hypothetical protein
MTIEKLSLNTSWQAGDRMTELTLARKAWSNHSGTFSGEPVEIGDAVAVGKLPEPEADEFRSALRTGAVTYVVRSYSTPIAWNTGAGWVIPDVRYSITTSKHQGKLYRLQRVAV